MDQDEKSSKIVLFIFKPFGRKLQVRTGSILLKKRTIIEYFSHPDPNVLYAIRASLIVQLGPSPNPKPKPKVWTKA